MENINVFPSFWAMKLFYTLMNENDEENIQKYLRKHIEGIITLFQPIFYLKGKNIINLLYKYPDTI